MHVYEVIPGIYKFISEVSFFKTYSTGYFRKQQNETGYFYKKTELKAGIQRTIKNYFAVF